MYLFDTSALIYAWENYPIITFPKFWDWFADQLETGCFVMSRVADKEIKKPTEGLQDWLREKVCRYIELDAEILQCALAVKQKWIGDADHHQNGAGENDLFFIAIAKIHSYTLITDEKQVKLPENKAKYKIPTVCSLPHVRVRCFSFIDVINEMSPRGLG